MTETPRKPLGAVIVDALLPPDMALACEAAGTAKGGRDALALFVLGLLAGAFIALGAVYWFLYLRRRSWPFRLPRITKFAAGRLRRSARIETKAWQTICRRSTLRCRPASAASAGMDPGMTRNRLMLQAVPSGGGKRFALTAAMLLLLSQWNRGGAVPLASRRIG
ncbi:MAG: hypothetical protein L6R19_16750 [Alphaproteobacteria bacterium]|nr:hypothetical protein [Alphaproteobacteria bacterium]